MSLTWDPITVVNLLLCTIIFIFGLIGYQRSKSSLPLYIAIAFGLFGLSHLATILGMKATLEIPLIVIRTLAYLLVTFALYLTAFSKPKKGKKR